MQLLKLIIILLTLSVAGCGTAMNETAKAAADCTYTVGYTQGKDTAEEIDYLKKENLSLFQSRLKTVWISLCIIVSLLMCTGMSLYLYHHHRQSSRKGLLSIATLEHELKSTQEEINELKKDLDEHKRSYSSAKAISDSRIEMLNGLLVSEITGNESYAALYRDCVDSIHQNKEEFIESIKRILSVSYPHFMEYLDKASLNENEKGIVCLYALGLRGKEISQYTQIKGLYNISSDIRRKLSIDAHETNLGIYIKRLIDNSQTGPQGL